MQLPTIETKETFEVRNKIVLLRTKEDMSDDAMSQISRSFKGAGAIEVIFAVGDYSEMKVELFSDEDLKEIGLTRLNLERKKSKGLSGKRKKSALQ